MHIFDIIKKYVVSLGRFGKVFFSVLLCFSVFFCLAHIAPKFNKGRALADNNTVANTDNNKNKEAGMNSNTQAVNIDNTKSKDIYLAGGCFWGIEAYVEKIPGVLDAVSGYANGNTENPSYEDLVYHNSGHGKQ